MAIIIGWKVEEGRKWPERLDIDPDHLDADKIKNLKETKQWFPDVKEFMHWKVKCTLEERDNGDREIVVKYTRNQQDDGNLLSYIEQHGGRYCFGKTGLLSGEIRKQAKRSRMVFASGRVKIRTRAINLDGKS